MSVQEHIAQAKNQINSIFDQLQNQLAQEAPAQAPEGGGGDVTAQVGKLRDFCYEMEEALTQPEIASVILKASVGILERAVLFLVKGGNLSSWQGVGLKGKGSPAEKVSVTIPANAPSILQKVVNEKVGQLENFEPSPGNNQIVQGLGGAKPTMMAAVPMVANDRVMLILYGDNAHTQQPLPDIAGLEILMINAELGMENVSLKKKLGQTPQKKAPRPRREIKAGASSPTGGAPEPTPTPQPTQPTPQPQPKPEPTPTPQPTQPQPTPQPTQPSVSPPKTDVGGLEGLSETERKQHEEAKAFASVIVSDIALYNQQKIEEGLKNGNLEQLLGGEFERGRRLYMQRVSPAVAKNTNYYDEAIQDMVDKKKKMLGIS